MITKKETKITQQGSQKLLVTREFDAPIEAVWKAWTDKNLLDAWWAPRPWKTETKSMDFREGGSWLYCMVGPEGERHWCRVDYNRIKEGKGFSGRDFFCDEEGNEISDPPGMHWKVDFSTIETGTMVIVEITFASEADLEKIVEMGFKEGFTMALSNLDEIFAERNNVA